MTDIVLIIIASFIAFLVALFVSTSVFFLVKNWPGRSEKSNNVDLNTVDK